MRSSAVVTVPRFEVTGKHRVKGVIFVTKRTRSQLVCRVKLQVGGCTYQWRRLVISPSPAGNLVSLPSTAENRVTRFNAPMLFGSSASSGFQSSKLPQRALATKRS